MYRFLYKQDWKNFCSFANLENDDFQCVKELVFIESISPLIIIIIIISSSSSSNSRRREKIRRVISYLYFSIRINFHNKCD
jgi:hypothetical protein